MYKIVGLVYLINYLKCVSADTPGRPFYRISMVSSHEKPGTPALFRYGDSPVWDQEQQCLFFVDVKEQKVHKLDYATGKISSKFIGYGGANVISLVAGSRRLLVSVRSSLYLLDWAVVGDAALRLLTTVDLGLPDNVINYGKCDAEGRFWAGTKAVETGYDVTDKGSLYLIDQETITNPSIKLRPVTLSNGIVWNHNNTVLYYIDSATQRIEAFDFYLPKGDLSGRRTIIDISSSGYEDVMPNGLTIDTQGNLWVALMFGGTILQIDPYKGRVINNYKLPVSHVSSLCWGGPNLDELFVTTAREATDVNIEPLAGAVFTIRDTGCHGVLPNMFQFENANYY